MTGSQRHAREPIGVALREPVPWHDLVQIVRTAEDTGYHALFVPEGVAREAFSTLAGLAGQTSRIRLGAGVLPMSARTPMLTAMGATTLQELSGGRLILGVGAGFVRRLEAVREYVREVRANLPELPDVSAPPPVWLAALGDGMIRLAGEVADGVLLNWCTPERAAQARQMIEEEATRAGRDPDAVEIGVYVRACIGPPEEEALAALKAAAGQYASLSHYRRQLEILGLGKEGLQAAEAFAADRPQDVPEALVRALCLLGDPDEAASRLEEFRQAGADLPVVYPVPSLEPVSSMMGTVLALAPFPAVEA